MVRTRVKIREGVARGCCGSCRYAHIMTDMNGKQEVLCEETRAIGALHIVRPLSECNQYKSLTDLTEWEAKQTGWVLEVKGARIIGFKPPDKDGIPT